MKPKGLFITFEGVEGSGKTTQIQLLKTYFERHNREVVQTKEPGGTALGIELRRMLLDSRYQFYSQYTEILIFTADRMEHIEQVIKPALSAGKVVLCDRFTDSTIAYQEAGRHVPISLVSTLLGLVDIVPDVTFLLDLDPKIGLNRVKNRLVQGSMIEESQYDRFEHEKIAFHERIRARYLAQAAIEPNRIKILHTDQLSSSEIHKNVLQLILEDFPC